MRVTKESPCNSIVKHNSKMKSVICILALLCTAYALEYDVTDPSRNLERLVNVQRIAAKAILDGLLIVQERTKQNLEMKLNELKSEASIEIHKTINEALENVNQAVEKGKQEGKNIDDCYNNAKNNLEMKNTNAIAGLETCVKNGKTAIESPLENVASTIEATEKLLSDLDAIIPNCYSSNFLKMQACVISNLLLTGATLNRIGTNARQVTTTLGVVYTKTIIDVRSCITANAANTRSFSTDVIITTNNCVRNAPIVPSTTTSKPSTTDKPLTTAKQPSTRKP